MIKIFCDLCKQDITQDNKYTLSIVKDKKPALQAVEMCGHCFVDIKSKLDKVS